MEVELALESQVAVVVVVERVGLESLEDAAWGVQ
jgi:hypothetical protein